MKVEEVRIDSISNHSKNPKKNSIIPRNNISEHELLFRICKSAIFGDYEAYSWLIGAGSITIKNGSSYFRFFESDRCGDSATNWRESVFERDGFTCAECGKKGEIQAHHIIPWAESKELRFELSNGITLCKSCHSKKHPGRENLILSSKYYRSK